MTTSPKPAGERERIARLILTHPCFGEREGMTPDMRAKAIADALFASSEPVGEDVRDTALVKRQIRSAFDSKDVPVKNMVLRKAADTIDRLTASLAEANRLRAQDAEIIERLTTERDCFAEQAAMRDQRDADMQEIMRLNNEALVRIATLERELEEARVALDDIASDPDLGHGEYQGQVARLQDRARNASLSLTRRVTSQMEWCRDCGYTRDEQCETCGGIDRARSLTKDRTDA